MKKKTIPFEFVIDALERIKPYTKPMFGCTAIYVDQKIMLIHRDRETNTHDNGVWLATTQEHHESLKKLIPSLRSISVLGKGVTGWQNIPKDSDRFEEEALLACSLVLKKDPRIGKIPKQKKPPSKKRAASLKTKLKK